MKIKKLIENNEDCGKMKIIKTENNGQNNENNENNEDSQNSETMNMKII